MKSKMRRAGVEEIPAREIRTRVSRTRSIQARDAQAGENQVTGNDQVRIEIQSFLQALRSYPERFASNPRLTFEEHCSGLAQTAKADPRRRV